MGSERGLALQVPLLCIVQGLIEDVTELLVCAIGLELESEGLRTDRARAAYRAAPDKFLGKAGLPAAPTASQIDKALNMDLVMC